MERKPSEGSVEAKKAPTLMRIPKKKRFSATDAADIPPTDEPIAVATSTATSTSTTATSDEHGDGGDEAKNSSGKRIKTEAPNTEEVRTGKAGDEMENSSNKGIKTEAPRTEETTQTPQNASGSPKSKTAKPAAPAPQISGEKFDPPILRKGDLVRLSNEQKAGRIQGGLARVTRSVYAEDDPDHSCEPISYDIEYVLGGKASNLHRGNLAYTTATAEGLIDAPGSSRGHLLRRRRSAATTSKTPEEKEKEEKKPSSESKKKGREKRKAVAAEDASSKRRGPGRPPSNKIAESKKDSKKRKGDRTAGSSKKRRGQDAAAAEDAPTTSAAKLKRSSSRSSDADDFAIKSQASKLGWETRRNREAAAKASTKASAKAAKSAGKLAGKASGKGAGGKAASGKAASKRYRKMNSTTDASECSDAASSAAEDPASGPAVPRGRTDMYTRHRRELEKSLSRMEKLDRYSFFLDDPPPEFDENYDKEEVDNDRDKGKNDGPKQAALLVQFPQHPPFNFPVIRKRLTAGRYDLDMVALELERRREIKAMLKTASMAKPEDEMTAKSKVAATVNSKDEASAEAQCADVGYEELSKTMCNPVAVDWDTFNLDVTAMCDAAILRDPQGVDRGPGHLGYTASRIKKLMEEIHGTYGAKRRLEVEEGETRLRYGKVLVESGNVEAAMQGKWRKHAFPERKYERLETTSVICDGLSDKDRSYAMYELETKLPDSFVGLAYTYDDSGQQTETWMKTVTDETSSQPATRRKSKSKKKKKDAAAEDSSASLDSSKGSETKAQKAVMALAKDDGVVRAQVQTTMLSLLIQVQDKVMTDLGVMHSPEARSANWDDGDTRRDYRGGSFEVEQGTHSGFSLPEVAEQEVWGVDCYTRKNVMALIEREFTPEIAVEFVEKWLLPAINACPVHLAHQMSTAARLLEGLPLDDPAAKAKAKPAEDAAANPPSASDAANLPPASDAANPNPLLLEEATHPPSNYPQDETSRGGSGSEKLQESSVFLRNALESKIRERGPPWLKAASRIIRLASSSLEDDFFRIHPKGHGSVVIGAHGLKANSLVTYYRGEVYPAWRWCEKLDAIEHVQKKLDLRPNLPDFYNMAMERPKKDPRGYCLLFVDASRKSGLGSSFSHSCNPTCEVRVVSLFGKLSLSMTTLRDLEQGEELTFDYNAVTESLNEYKFAVCLCGQRKCRGSFLHYATADCYQQVLSRNSPISARFANLVRGCMKQVMSKEDSELLLKHGFNTAAFGAVSFNHHVSNGDDPQSTPDSIENVPIWLRTYVADCLRYIEYERRALPVALLCNQMERMEKKQGKHSKNASTSKKAKLLERQLSTSNESVCLDKSKAVSGSKPKTSYFFFLQSQRDYFGNIVKKQHDGPELKGLEFSQALNKEASRAWAALSEEEKQKWKKKSIADWKKSGGKKKAKLEEERQRLLKKGLKGKAPKEKGPKEVAKSSDKRNVGTTAKDEGKRDGSNPTTITNDLPIETKKISIADADAEGFSAMEQRIQQLAQSLSRIGRVLDRHRESVFAEKTKGCNKPTTVDSDLLRNLVPSPLKIMSDEEVVNWIWSDPKGVVRTLFTMVERHFPQRSLLLRKLLSNAEKCYPVLSAFGQHYSSPTSHLEKKFKHSCTASDARRLVREALLKLRTCIIDFLHFAEKRNAEARNEKRREKARAREKKKLKEAKISKEVSIPLDATDVNIEPPAVNATEGQNREKSLQRSDSEIPLRMNNNLEDEAISIRGGGGDCTAPTDSPSGIFDSSRLDQDSALKPLVGPQLSNMASVDANDTILPPVKEPPVSNDVRESDMDGATNNPTLVQSTVRDNVQSSSIDANDTILPPAKDPPVSNDVRESAMDEATNTPTLLQSTARDDVKSSPTDANDTTLPPAKETPVSNPVQTAMDGATNTPTSLQSTAREDVQSLLQLSQATEHHGAVLPGDSACGHNHQPHTRPPSAQNEDGIPPIEKAIQSPSRLQHLLNAVASNEECGVGHTPVNGQNDGDTLLPPSALPQLPPSAPSGTNAAASNEECGVGHAPMKGQNDGETLHPPSALPQLPLSAPSAPATPSDNALKTQTPKKKAAPLLGHQVKYLKDWLFDPKHILNPYPTDEEKNVIMKETRVDRKRIDSWFMKNRQRVLSPEVPPVEMKWKEIDQDHWAEFWKNRYMLEATTDLLLMYANTNTFFLLEPFRQFDSTPIEVYARELGNEVPRRFALNCTKSNGIDVNQDALNSIGNVAMENSACEEEATTGRTKRGTKKNKDKKEGSNDEFCSLEEVVDKVTVDYSGDYVLSQLLQWVNGGIGQKKGLPDIYGCVMLPPVSGCWDETKCSEVKLPNYTKWNRKTTTEYAAEVRSKLAEWFLDRYQRGSAWEEDVAKYFCPLDQMSPDSTMPMGSPVLDYLVTGIDENIRHVSAALSGRANTTEQGRTRLSASDRLQSTVDEGMPAQAVANWVQCENPNCLKWRKLPWHVDVDLLPEKFFCKDNVWNPSKATCDASEDEWDMDDAPIKFDTSEDNFEVGAWFDVQREGKVGYHEAQIADLDFKSSVKRVKFHFWKLSSDLDEWVEVGSPRIAPHHSYTPRPLEGYRGKGSNTEKNKCCNNESNASGSLSQKRKADHLASSQPTEGTSDESKKKQFSQETIDYLKKWISQHAANPFPTPEEKQAITAATGLNKRQVGDWMARARKKLRKKTEESNKVDKTAANIAAITSIQNSPTKVENLLLALRDQLPQQSVSLGGMGQTSVQEKTEKMVPTGNVEPVAAQEVNAGKVSESTPTIDLGGQEDQEHQKTTIKELEAYMKTWFSRPENAASGVTLMPTLAQKENIILDTGIEKKRLEGWFFRARKKLKKQQDSTGSQVPQLSVLKESPMSATNAAPSANSNSSLIAPRKGTNISGKPPAVQQLLKKSGASHTAQSSGMDKLPLKTIQSGQSIPIRSMKASAANETSSLMKEGEKSQNMTTMKSVKSNTPTEVANASKSSMTKTSKPDLAISLMKAGKAGQKAPTSLSNLPQKGLSESAKNHLNRWLSEHASNPYPSREEKNSLVAALGIDNCRGMRMLDGWFCRARKKLKASPSSNKSHSNSKVPTHSRDNANFKPPGERTLHPPGHSVDGLIRVEKPEQSSGSSIMASSNFASLLSAAKSELGTNSRGASPQNMLDSKKPESSSQYRSMEASRFSGEDESRIKGSHYAQGKEIPPPHIAQHGFTPAGERKLEAREQAILSSFQSLKAVEIRPRRSPPTECPPHQRSQAQQQGAPSTDYLSYTHSQGHQQVPHAKYASHQQSQDCQRPQGHQQVPSTKYQTHQQVQNLKGAPPADYSSYQHPQIHQQAPPSQYQSYQHSQGHQQAPLPSEHPSYRHTQSQHRAPPAEYARYQQQQGQRQAPSNDYSSHQRAQVRRQPPPDYSSYQHLQAQNQNPPAAYSSPGQGYIYPPPGSNPSTYEVAPNGSQPQVNGFRQGQLHNSTFQN